MESAKHKEKDVFQHRLVVAKKFVDSLETPELIQAGVGLLLREEVDATLFQGNLLNK